MGSPGLPQNSTPRVMGSALHAGYSPSRTLTPNASPGRTLEEEFSSHAPEHLLDPVTCILFRDPVVAPSGESFELEGLLRMGADPLTRQPVDAVTLPVNRALKRQVDKFIHDKVDSLARTLREAVQRGDAQHILRAIRVMRQMEGRDEDCCSYGRRSLLSALQDCPAEAKQQLDSGTRRELDIILRSMASPPPIVGLQQVSREVYPEGSDKGGSDLKAHVLFGSSPTSVSGNRKAGLGESGPGVGKCSVCRHGVPEGDSVRAGANLYHDSCFRCTTCAVKIDDRYNFADGLLLCADCFIDARCEHCATCRRGVAEGVRISGKAYHYGCLRCDTCALSVKHGEHHVADNGKILCGICHKRTLPLCQKCIRPVDGGLEVLGSFWHADCLNCCRCDVSLVNSGMKTFDGVTPMCTACFESEHLPNCAKCGRRITAGLTALGKSWHTECFQCNSCGLPLAGETYRTMGNDSFCESCYINTSCPKCVGCGQPAEERVTANAFPGKYWHVECFKCTKCNSVLTDIFKERNGNLFCDGCFSEDYLPQCKSCKKAIKGELLTALGASWHPSCFSCVHCKKAIGSDSFHTDPAREGRPVCEACFEVKVLPQCHKCKLPIREGACAVFKGNRIHQNCFKCSVCQQVIKAGYAEIKDSVVCPTCAGINDVAPSADDRPGSPEVFA